MAIRQYAEQAARLAAEEATAAILRRQQEQQSAATALQLAREHGQLQEQLVESHELARRANGRTLPPNVYAMNDPRRWRDASDPRVRPYRAVTTDMLRQLAQSYDVLASCIAYLKTEVLKTELVITPLDDKDDSPTTQKQIKDATYFFKHLNGGLGGWGKTRLQFEGEWLDDLLVIGASALYLEYDTVGSLTDKIPDRITAIDASTIKPVITPYGFAPDEDAPAFEQVVQGQKIADFYRHELMYDGLPIFGQTHTPYFLSPVELLVHVVFTALKTDEWNRTWLTDGNVPDSLIQVPKDWTPAQIQEYSDYFDLLLAGNSRNRHKAKIVPEGTHGSAQSRKEADFAAFELWLRDRTHAMLGVHPSATGHSSQTYKFAQEGAMDATRGGRVAQILLYRSIKYTNIAWLKGWDKIQVSDEMTDAEDLKAKADRVSTMVKSGLKTINEGRKDMGDDPSEEPGADMLLMQQGTVTLQSIIEPPPSASQPPLANSGGANDSQTPNGDPAIRQNVLQEPGNSANVGQDTARVAMIETELSIARGKHTYSCVMVPIHEAHGADDSMDWAKENFEDTQLTQDGIVDDPHITVLYGLHAEKPKSVANAYQNWCDQNEGWKVRAKIGNFAIFRKREAEDWDVLVYEVESSDLHSLNEALAELPHTNDYDYKPHLTVAYVQAGEADEWEGKPGPLTGRELVFERLLFSSKDGKEYWIDNDSDHTYIEEIERVLRQWERKCLNRVARGQSATCDFADEALPADVADYVREALETAPRNKDAVRRVFEEIRDTVLIERLFNPNQPRDELGQWASVGRDVRIHPLKSGEPRAFTGEPIPIEEKFATVAAKGKLGERIIAAWLRSKDPHGMADVQTHKRSNYPIDLLHHDGHGNYTAYEAKTGTVDNNKKSQDWRLKIGQPGKAETELLKTMPAEEKAAWNLRKRQAIHERKRNALEEIKQQRGTQNVKLKTIAVILDPDRKVADIHIFEGVHDYIGWNTAFMKAGYQESVKYDDL